MQAIRFTRKIESETLHLPQLRPLVGQEVEIIVLSPDTVPSLDKSAAPATGEKEFINPLAGSVLRDDDPFSPAVPAEEWEACR